MNKKETSLLTDPLCITNHTFSKSVVQWSVAPVVFFVDDGLQAVTFFLHYNIQTLFIPKLKQDRFKLVMYSANFDQVSVAHDP